MKDPLFLIGAATGGFMLSLAASSIIHATSVISLKSSPSVETLHTKHLEQPVRVDESVSYTLSAN